jgi:hypothetical protein
MIRLSEQQLQPSCQQAGIRAGAAFIVTLWLLTTGALIWWLWPHVAL